MKRQRWLRAVLAVLLVATIGCAHRGVPRVVEPEPKPDVGTVELRIAAGPPSPKFQRPGIVGSRQGAKDGAKTGALAPIVPGLALSVAAAKEREGTFLVVGLMLTGAGIALAPIGAGVGAVVGALTAPSAEEVQRSAVALEHAFDDANLSNALTEWIMEAAGPRSIVRTAAPGTTVDTLLEIDVPELALSSSDPKDRNPDLRLRVTVTARLVRASDGEQLRAFSWAYEGPKATFAKWAGDDARMLRAELPRAGRALAAKVLADLW